MRNNWNVAVSYRIWPLDLHFNNQRALSLPKPPLLRRLSGSEALVGCTQRDVMSSAINGGGELCEKARFAISDNEIRTYLETACLS